MKQIWKYPIEETGQQSIEIPDESKILCVQVQKGVPCLWVEVDDEYAPVLVYVFIVTTGETFDLAADYVGTFQLYNGSFVGHVYVSKP